MHYKDLEPGNSFNSACWGSREEAESILDAALRAYEAEGHNEKENVEEDIDAKTEN